jgi:hypothetical protein
MRRRGECRPLCARNTTLNLAEDGGKAPNNLMHHTWHHQHVSTAGAGKRHLSDTLVPAPKALSQYSGPDIATPSAYSWPETSPSRQRRVISFRERTENPQHGAGISTPDILAPISPEQQAASARLAPRSLYRDVHHAPSEIRSLPSISPRLEALHQNQTDKILHPLSHSPSLQALLLLEKSAFTMEYFAAGIATTPPGNTVAPRPDDIRREMRKLSRKLQKVSNLTDIMLTKRYRVEHQQQTLDSSYKFLQQNIDALLSKIDPKFGPWQGEEAFQAVQEKRKVAFKDYEAVRLQSDEIKVLREELSTMEYHLMTKQERIAERLKEFSAKLAGELVEGNGQDLGSITDSSESAAGTHLTEMPEIVEKYYDRKGDVNILCERLEFLDEEYNDQVVRRDLLHERGDLLSETESQFQAKHQTQRQELLDSIDKANREADDLEQACKEAGYELHHPPPPESSAALTNSAFELLEPDRSYVATSGDEMAMEPVSGIDRPRNDRIEGWLNEVPQQRPVLEGSLAVPGYNANQRGVSVLPCDSGIHLPSQAGVDFLIMEGAGRPLRRPASDSRLPRSSARSQI